MRELLHAWRDFFIDVGDFTVGREGGKNSVRVGDSLSMHEMQQVIGF